MHLQSLSDQEILSRIHKLAARERSLTRAVLLHLNEIERRRLHLKLGYASMFDYCTSGLGYSASAAMRRIKAARCLARYPRVDVLLQENAVNLSTIAQVSDLLTEENHDEVLTRIQGKSQREVEAILAEYRPGTLPRERVRTIVVRVPARSMKRNAAPSANCVSTVAAAVGPDAQFALVQNGLATRLPVDACEKSDYYRNGSSTSSPSVPAREVEKRALLQFSASEAFMAKLEKIKSLAWHRLPASPSLEQVFELVVDHFIEREDPRARRERREGRNERPPAMRERPSSSEARNRHIAAAVKDEVFSRDGGRCTYVGSSGRRCTSTLALQFDHITPVARGGEGTLSNLRLLCAYHNRVEAERIIGSTATQPTTGSSPTPTAPGSSRGRPSRVPT